MIYRVVLTILAVAVFAFVLLTKQDDGAAPPVRATTTDEPNMKGLTIP